MAAALAARESDPLEADPPHSYDFRQDPVEQVAAWWLRELGFRCIYYDDHDRAFHGPCNAVVLKKRGN